MILSFVLGGLAQMYRTLGNYYPVLGDSTTFIICVFCSMFTALIIGFNPMGMCFGPTVLGAVIWELPGTISPRFNDIFTLIRYWDCAEYARAGFQEFYSRNCAVVSIVAGSLQVSWSSNLRSLII